MTPEQSEISGRSTGTRNSISSIRSGKDFCVVGDTDTVDFWEDVKYHNMPFIAHCTYGHHRPREIDVHPR